MNLIWYGILLDVLALAVGLTLCTFGYRWSRHDGYEAGYNEGRADRAQEVMAEREAERKAPRHAKTKPRTSLVWDRDEAVGGPVEIPVPASRYADGIRRRMAEVVLPEPGMYLPQPGRDSGPGTVTFGQVREELSTTGEILALTTETDAWIADRAVEEETYRLGLTS